MALKIIRSGQKFLSTPSARRATLYVFVHHKAVQISIHALREEGDTSRSMLWIIPVISIHALREEGDTMFGRSAATIFNFYPRPPRGGRRSCSRASTIFFGFLSTPSARRATVGVFLSLIDNKFLSTPSARRATPNVRCAFRAARHFYPRPPRGGRPCARRFSVGAICHFYPRPPRGGRQIFLHSFDFFRDISIHALREEGDITIPFSKNLSSNFYPRPPRGGRQNGQICTIVHKKFLSTPSARRATDQVQYIQGRLDISIHALREEGDFLPPIY